MKKTIILLSVSLLIVLFLGVRLLKAQTGKDLSREPQKKLVVGVLHDPPYIMQKEDGEWTGINVDIWKAVAQDLNVGYEFKEMNFQELIEALQNNRIDISIEAFFVLAERQKLIDYSFAFGNTRFAVATPREKLDHPWWMAVKIFFSWGTLKVLGFLGLLLGGLGFLFWLIERKANLDHFGGGFLNGIGSGIYWVGSTLASGVCFGITLKSLAARILGLVWMLACTIALSALIASLTSTLFTVRAMTPVIDDEALRRMRLGGVVGSAESMTLENLGGKYILYQDEEKALQAMLRGEVDGFIYDEITLHWYKDNGYADKMSIYPTLFKRYAFAFGFPRDSPLRRKVDYAILTLRDKPDWGFLLKRYGLEEDFTEKSATALIKRKPQ
jgi:ABC-type amino acid transport substrate-binding protein